MKKILLLVVAAVLGFASCTKDLENRVSKLEDSVESIQQKLDAQNIKIALGIDVSHSDYTQNIESFVTSAQDYLDQYYLTTNIAIEIMVKP